MGDYILKSTAIFILAAAAVLTFSGCGDDTVNPECADNSEALRNYLIANDMDFPDLLTNWLITADMLNGHEANYHIMDIRDESIYDQGHIPGADHSSLSGILADAVHSTKPIIVVCYTGQSAGHAVMALRLSGYSKAMVLKYGMSSWNSRFDFWTGNCTDVAKEHAGWIEPPGDIDTSEEQIYPSISICTTDGASILAQRVTALLNGGFKRVNGIDVLNTPSGYFINNYWPADTVTTYGNIAGARIIYPISLENGGFSHCDPGATVVTYCWSGHLSSMLTAYMTVLGYDALSLMFGVNGMIYSDLTTNEWESSFDYPYETTVP